MKPNVCSLDSLGLHHVLSLTPLAAPNSIQQEELLDGDSLSSLPLPQAERKRR